MSSSRSLTAAKSAAALAVAVPAIGIAYLALREAIAEPGGVSLNRAFHTALGVAVLLLLADLLIAIRRSRGVGTTLVLGTGGFVAVLVGALLSEFLGPPAVLVLLLIGLGWAVFLAMSAPGSEFAESGP